MEQSTSYRSHTCGELRMEHAGQRVKLAGFLDNVREVSASLAFAVLRDFYGVTQLVVEDEALLTQLKELNKESTLCVTGTVRKNPKLPTGDIEVVPETIEVLGRCRHNELPFPIARSREADESARLKYRYLDLRNEAVKHNIVLRCQVVAALRAAMIEKGFLEITTPNLTASSPEGARDYLVPSRKHPGKFYALPQAPQQFKQLWKHAVNREHIKLFQPFFRRIRLGRIGMFRHYIGDILKQFKVFNFKPRFLFIRLVYRLLETTQILENIPVKGCPV